MNDSDISDLARMLPVPDARDFQAGRQQTLKEHLMTEFRIAGDHQAGLSPVRRVRLRPRILGAAAAVAVAVGVAVGVTLPASHPAASHPASGPAVQPAAWTVTRQADGTIHVSFFGELRDPAALQRALRADGVPASVTFIGQQNPACRNDAVQQRRADSRARALAQAYIRSHPGSHPNTGNGTWLAPDRPGDALAIRPAALPSGDGLQIAVMRGIPLGPAGPWPYPKDSGHAVFEVGLVKASPQCTGS
jgi:hypothetical protein